jgi:hypothetical protein
MIRRTPTLGGAGPVRVFARGPASLTIRTVAVEGKEITLEEQMHSLGRPAVHRIAGRTPAPRLLSSCT